MTKKIWTVIMILYIGFIFHNSMVPAIESSRQSGGVLAVVLETVNNFGMDGSWITEHIIRKMAHFAEYAVLGILLNVTISQYHLMPAVGRILRCWLGIIIPFTDETIQLFVEGRSGQISDVWLDMSGVLTGILFAAAAVYFTGKRRAKKNEEKPGNASPV